MVEEVFQDLSLGIKVLILMRGLPGSGKTYLADSILEAALESPVRSDHISSTKKNLENQMIRGCTPVIVDEVNLQIWDMEPYAHIAVKYGYRIHILEMTTKWSNNLKKLEKKTKDDISKEELKRMRDIFIKDITPEYLLVECGLTLRYQLELKNNSTKGGRKSMTSDRIKRLDASFALKFQNSSVDENKEKTFDRKNENYLLNEKYLFDTFPHVDENVIVELLHSNDFDYDRTEEDLLVAFENEETLNNVSGSLEATGSKKKNNNRRRRRRKNK